MFRPFLCVNLHAKIKAFLNKRTTAGDSEYPYSRRKLCPDAIEDIYDATEYTRLSQEGEFERHFVETTWERISNKQIHYSYCGS